MGRRKDPDTLVLVHCRRCNKENHIPGYTYRYLIKRQKNFYCNRECFHPCMKRGDWKLICDQCGKEFTRNRRQTWNIKRAKKHFCTRPCQLDYLRENPPVYPGKYKRRQQRIANRYFGVTLKEVEKYNLMPFIELKELQMELKQEVKDAEA